MSDEAAAARGNAAQRELTETSAAFDAVRQAMIDEMIQTSVVNVEKILRLQAAIQTLSAVQKALQNVVDSGVMARTALSQAGLTQL